VEGKNSKPSRAASPFDPVGNAAAPAPPGPPDPLALKPVLPGTIDGVELLEDAHDEPSPVEGEAPAEASAVRHDEAEGEPAPPFPLALLAAESSETVDGVPPHAVPRLAFVGTPGDASAVLQVDAFVGSCAEPKPGANAPAAPVARDRIVARTRPSDVERFERLVSASAVGPVVSGAGVLPSGADGLVVVVVVAGALAVVPGALAVVDALDAPLGCGAVPLDAITGSLDEMTAGPSEPPLAVAVPPAAGCSVPGRRSGWSASRGSSASATVLPRFRSAMTAKTLKSLRMSFPPVVAGRVPLRRGPDRVTLSAHALG
jgi:hypothetical protein